MDKKILDLLEELERFGKERHMFNIPKEAGEFLNLLVKIKKPKNILEVGTSNGYSTIWLGLDGDKIVTIEKNPEKLKLAKENFKKAGLKNTKVIEGDALEILHKLNEKFDFVFIDAIKKDYLNYFKLIKFNKGAIVVADNILTHNLKEYCDFVREKYKSCLVKIGNGVEVTII
ncbi:MAG: O-methyltransferase [Candidatus Woesearchaeota archaeon]